jgi:hypothetical protein
MLPQLQYVKPRDSININDHPCAIFCGSVVCLSAVLFLCLSVSLEAYTAHRDRDILVRTGVLLNTEYTGCPGTTGQPECPVYSYRDSGKPNPGTRYITLRSKAPIHDPLHAIAPRATACRSCRYMLCQQGSKSRQNTHQGIKKRSGGPLNDEDIVFTTVLSCKEKETIYFLFFSFSYPKKPLSVAG